MSTEKARVTKTPAQKLAELQAKQTKLAQQIAAQKRIADKREREAMQGRIDRLGKLALDFGLDQISESDLSKAFAEIVKNANPADSKTSPIGHT